MLIRASLIIAFWIFSAHAQPTQPTDTAIHFEVASIRPVPPIGRAMFVGTKGGPGSTDPGRMTFGYVTLASLVRRAYGIDSFQLFCPDWLYTERFDITAKVPEGATKEQIPMMLQNLLADRFKLKVHSEMKVMPIYELSVAKGGPKMKASVGDTAHQDGVSGEPSLGRDGFPVIPPGRAGMLVIDGRARWQAPDAEMAQLVKMLAREVGKPVIDATGIKGRYDMSLRWVSGQMSAGLPGATADAEDVAPESSASDVDFGPTIFRALWEQLGLQLDPKKGSAAVLVVDSAAKLPTEN